MTLVAAFDIALLNRVETMPQWHKWFMCVKEHINVFLFLITKKQMTNENAGHYVNMRDKGSQCYAVKWKAGYLVTLYGAS